MMPGRPQDRWFAPDAAAQLRKFNAQVVAKAWKGVILWGVLALVASIGAAGFWFGDRDEQHQAARYMIWTVIWVVRFGYSLWRLVSAKKEAREMQCSINVSEKR